MVLFIDAACRYNSRTRKLAYSYIDELSEQVKELRLYETKIPLLDEQAIEARELAVANGYSSNPFVAMASEFAAASKIVICAPYWDMGYPAILRSYIEAIMVNGITFTYDSKGNPEGKCAAEELHYFTTAGGHIASPDLGYIHIKSLATKMLGIENVYYYSAERLDLEGSNPDKIIDDKIREIRQGREIDLETVSRIAMETRTIMVVDDSKINILKAEHILKEKGFHTESAGSGEECLKKLKVHRPDLILLDVKMPEMDGFQTLNAIRSEPEWSQIPIIFVTGENTMENVLEASKMHAAGYVTKPFTEEELMKHIRKIFK